MEKFNVKDLDTIREAQNALILICDTVMDDLSEKSKEALSKITWQAANDLEKILAKR